MISGGQELWKFRGRGLRGVTIVANLHPNIIFFLINSLIKEIWFRAKEIC